MKQMRTDVLVVGGGLGGVDAALAALRAGRRVVLTEECHITNGCYRMHPVEWNVGEVAGAPAAFCLDRRVTPRAVRNDPRLLAEFQARLDSDGVEPHWPDVTGY